MVDETIPEKCETLYNKLNSFVESEISRDVTPQISNLNSRINALEPNLVRVKEVNGNASSVSAGGTSTQTFTVPACPSGYGWKYFSTSTGWGTVSSVSLSGTTLTVTLLNVSNTSHDISFSGALMYYPTTMKAEQHISISATNPYLLEGEVTDLVVSLVDEFGLPLRGKTVTIGQSVFIDDGTTASHNDSWSVTNGTMTRMDSYTRLVESAQTLMCQMNSGYISPTSIVEFDFKAVDGVKNWGLLYIRNSGGDTSLADLSLNYVGGEIGEWIHLKIVFNNTNTITIYSSKLDNPITKTLSSTSPNYRLLLYGGGVNTELHFKNVKVYETIKGVTDEKGEFALHDVSVTDDTTFTASYGTETATCLVEYCTFVDYAVKDKHNHNYFNQQGTSNITITEADEYKEFKTISTTAGNVYLGSSTSYTGFDVGDTWTIIWEKLYIDGYNVGFQCYNGSATYGINSTTLGLHNSDFQELKFVCDGSSIKAYVDGVYKTQTSYTSTGHGYLRINLNNNNGASQVTFRAKNIRIK